MDLELSTKILLLTACSAAIYVNIATIYTQGNDMSGESEHRDFVYLFTVLHPNPQLWSCRDIAFI